MAKYEKWIEPEGLEKIRSWSAAGLTDEQIAQNMSIARKTLYEWRGRYKDINEALESGRGTAIEQVENSLYKKCLGYTVNLQKTYRMRIVDYDPDTGKKIGEHEELVPGIDQMHVPADTAAIKFFLTNKKPEEWKNNVSFEGAVTGGIEDYLKTLEEEPAPKNTQDAGRRGRRPLRETPVKSDESPAKRPKAERDGEKP